MEKRKNMKHLLRQSNTMSLARHNLTALEKRILYLVISRIKPDDKDFQEYKFTVKEVIDRLDIGNNNRKYLYETCDDLMKKTYTIISEDGGRVILAPISSAKFDEANTEVVFRFDPNAKPHYLELKNNYTQFQLEIVLGLKSVYSQKIYEIAKSIAFKGNKAITKYTLDEWRFLLYIDPDAYQNFKDFRRYVFNVASLEITEKTDLYVKFSEEKKGKKVTVVYLEVQKIADEKQREDLLKSIKFDQLPKRKRSELGEPEGKPNFENIGDRVEAKKKAIQSAEEAGLFERK